MQALYDVPAPAKLNLFLHITGRRDDGYHLLQSVFMLVDWCDTLHFERSRSNSADITREDLGPALPDVDLTVRAARALHDAIQADKGADNQFAHGNLRFPQCLTGRRAAGVLSDI